MSDVEMAVGTSERTGRRYYGRYIVAACNVVAMMTWGIGVFNQGVFLRYFVDSYGWSRSALSVGPMLFYVWAGLVGVLIGRVIDRLGPRPILIAGALLLGAGTTALGFAREPWHVYPGFLLLGSGYSCLHTVTLGAIVSRWFMRQRARAMGAATFGASFGGMILAPLNAVLLERWGGPAGGLTLATIAIVLVVPLTLWVVKDGPEAVGQTIDGDDRMESRERSVERDGPSATTAVGSRWPSRQIAAAMFALQAVGLALSAAPGSQGAPWLLVAGSITFGLTMGIVVSIQPVVAADCFGRRAFGRVYGPIYLAIQLGTGFGSLVFRLTATALGSYGPILGIMSGTLLLAAFGMRWATPPR